MDADLFSPEDTAALLAIRAVVSNRRASAAEMKALFSSTGLLPVDQAGGSAVDALRALLKSAANR